MILNTLKLWIYSFLIFLPLEGLKAQNTINEDSISLINQANELLFQVPALSKTNLDSAVLLMEQALPLVIKAKSWESYYIPLLNGISTTHFYRDDFEKCRIFAEEAVNEALRLLGDDHRTYSETLNNLAILCQRRGEYDQSIELLNRSLEIYGKDNINENKLASAYQNLAINYRLKDDFLKALNHRKKALEINQRTLDANNAKLGVNYKNIGLTFKHLLKYDSALVYLKKGLDILKRDSSSKNNIANRNTISTLHGLAEVWMLKENPEKADTYIHQALRLQKTDKAYVKAFSFELLAKKLMLERKFDEAYSAIQKANKLAGDNYKNNSYPAIARKFLLTAEILYQKEDLDSAVIYVQKGLETLAPDYIFKLPFDNPIPQQILAKSKALEILSAKAKYFKLLYDLHKDEANLLIAYNTYIMAIELIRNRRHGNLTSYAKNELAQKSMNIYENAILVSLESFNLTQDYKYKEQAFLIAENNKSLLLLESINEQFAKGNSSIPDSILEIEKNLSIDISFYQKKILEEKQQNLNQDKIKKWNDILFTFQQKHDFLIKHLEEKYPSYHELKYDNHVSSIKKIQSNILGNKSALIEYFIGEENIYLFCLTSKELNVTKLEIENLPDQIQNLRSIVSNPPKDGMSIRDIHEFWKISNNCYNTLIEPAIQQLNPDIDELFIVPDGILAYVPYDILLTNSLDENSKKLPSANDYLLSKYSISYDYSATLLAKNNSRKSSSYNSDFIAYAPSFQGEIAMLRDCDGAQLSKLRCNQNEVENIAAILRGKINLGLDASSTNFINSHDQNRIIHLATHACVDNQSPMLNQVYFSDNSLTLLDFYNTRLNTELVVLSACNTGIGKIQKGEGVMSIARGFMAAGSPSTMLSLWSVDDCSTSDMMSYYYKNLKAGDKKNKALQKAKLEFLKTAPKAMKHPFYWGAFVQFGNTEHLDFSNGIGWQSYWMAFGLGSILFLYFQLIYRKRDAS